MPATLHWTPEEDDRLRELVDRHGPKAWAKIAGQLRSKGSKQCRRRWKNFLNMSAKTCSWSPEEDATLMDAHNRLGNRWTEISKIFGDRTDNAVKNRWHALIRKHPNLDREDEEEEGAPRAKRRRTTRAAATAAVSEEDSDLRDSGRYGQSSMQYNSSGSAGGVLGSASGGGGITAAALPTPFDQQQSAAVVLPNISHPHYNRMSLQQQQQQQQAAVAAAQQFALHQQRQVAAAAAGGQHQYLVNPPQAPLQIKVNKDFLTPWEQQLADQINAMNLPVHVEVAPAPLPLLPLVDSLLPEGLSGPDMAAARSSWKHYVEKLDEPGDSKGLQELLDWFGNAAAAATAAAPGGGGSGGLGVLGSGGFLPQGFGGSSKDFSLGLGLGSRRVTRAASQRLEGRSSSDSLAGDHRQLLVKLMSRGLEARSSSEQRLEPTPAAAAAAMGNGGGSGGGGTLGSGSCGLPPLARFDPMKRTRSSNSRGASGEMERAAAQLVQQQGAAAAAAAGQPLPQLATQAAATQANARTRGGSGALGASLLQSTSLSMPLPEPTPLERGFSDVFVTPTFSSQEISMLIEALKPKP